MQKQKISSALACQKESGQLVEVIEIEQEIDSKVESKLKSVLDLDSVAGVIKGSQ